jgi:ABC-type Fe3+ transport system permease subunit
MSQQWSPPSTGTPAKVPNNLVLAIVASVVSFMFCCLPHGLISLYFALQVDNRSLAGDLEGANNAAKQAKMWAWISLILAIVGLVLAFVFGVIGGVLSAIGSR